MMRYNIIEKARREICVLFPFCAGERHDADLSKPGQSAEKKRAATDQVILWGRRWQTCQP
nr:MAG TPA: hypothetical protein [Caudoviricetes sp.]